MTLAKFRSWLYALAKTLGDVQSVKSKRVGRRVGQRVAGKATGRLMRSIFK